MRKKRKMRCRAVVGLRPQRTSSANARLTVDSLLYRSKGTPIAPQDPTRKLPKQSGTRFGINNGYHASESSTSNSRAPRSLVNIAVVDARKDAQKQSEKIQAYTIPNSSKANQTGVPRLFDLHSPRKIETDVLAQGTGSSTRGSAGSLLAMNRRPSSARTLQPRQPKSESGSRTSSTASVT